MKRWCDWCHDLRQVGIIDLLFLAFAGVCSLIVSVLHGTSIMGWLYTLRGICFVIGSLGLFILAGLLIFDKAKKEIVKDRHYETYFYKLSFPMLIAECAVWFIGIGLFADFGVRALL